MNTHRTAFFPSLYDPPQAAEDIWGSVLWRQNSALRVFKARPWPDTSTLLRAEYQPLEFYSPPAGGAAEPWSEMDDVCELYIRLKEIELLHQLGEEFDDRRYYFLSTVQYEKEKQMGCAERSSVQKKRLQDKHSI